MRLVLVGLAHVVLLPFLLLFMVVYFFLQNAQEWHSSKVRRMLLWFLSLSFCCCACFAAVCPGARAGTPIRMRETYRGEECSSRENAVRGWWWAGLRELVLFDADRREVVLTASGGQVGKRGVSVSRLADCMESAALPHPLDVFGANFPFSPYLLLWETEKSL